MRDETCKAVGYGFWSNMVVLVLVILDIVFAVLTHEYNVFGSVKIIEIEKKT